MATLDYLLVGGGLQNCLIALAIRAAQPEARIEIVERGDALGGNHTWCFHAGDLSPHMRQLIAPAIAAQWDGYDVAFPRHARTLSSPYAAVTSSALAALVEARVGARAIRTRTTVRRVEAGVATIDSETIHARAVVDARGPDRAEHRGATGWQKFLGQEVVLVAPHGLDRPIVMDATVPQRDGYRFLYVLPLAPDRLLLEDTYFSDSSHLDVAALRTELDRYAAARGWAIHEIVREETGVLPMPREADPPLVRADAPLVAGYAGGWYHPATGYSFPIAARLAETVAATPADRMTAPDGAVAALAAAYAHQLPFAWRLNKMLFQWFAPAQRINVLERFYRAPEATIRRFYALEMTTLDRARILVGRPPRGLSVRAMFGGVA